LLIKVYAASEPNGLGNSWRSRRPPIFLGSKIAGVIEKVGDSVTTLRVGDEVYGTVKTGGYADYALAKLEGVVPKLAALNLPLGKPCLT
jgi:NADPH:quinone reductase-like Zn-dependent oxidoreductase